jgi:hypothetical protein
MKDVFAAFGSEVFRPLITLLLPGLIALSSWSVALFQWYPPFWTIAAANHAETGILVALAALFVGLVIEDLATRIETTVFDGVREHASRGKHFRNWFQYLRIAFKTEPAGRRHLRNVVMRLKFELGAAIALFSCFLGLQRVAMPADLRWWLCKISIALSFYLVLEGWATHGVLARLRSELLGPIIVVE